MPRSVVGDAPKFVQTLLAPAWQQQMASTLVDKILEAVENDLTANQLQTVRSLLMASMTNLLFEDTEEIIEVLFPGEVPGLAD